MGKHLNRLFWSSQTDQVYLGRWWCIRQTRNSPENGIIIGRKIWGVAKFYFLSCLFNFYSSCHALKQSHLASEYGIRRPNVLLSSLNLFYSLQFLLNMNPWFYVGNYEDLPLNTGGADNKSSLVVCFGEMLIDFVPTVGGVSLAEAPAFKKAAGGAPANVAVGVSKLGGSSAFIGKVLLNISCFPWSSLYANHWVIFIFFVYPFLPEISTTEKTLQIKLHLNTFM